MNSFRKRLGIAFVAAAILIVAGVAYVNSSQRQSPSVFSSNKQLEALWRNYKLEYLEPVTGRTLDKQRNNLTTSEGESYTMLRAVWQDDQETFDQSLKWTNDNLRRKDELFSWQFGQLPNGQYGILKEQGGENTASDADTDIAMALIFAARRFQEEKYLDQAKKVVNGIWEEEVVLVQGKPVLVANNLEKGNQKMIVNPSYFSPAAYRMFEQIDPKHDWEGLVDNSYAILDRVSGEKTLVGNPSVGLPPDWILLDRQTGEISAPTAGNLTTNYSFDAIRTPFRLALDYRWYGEKRAQEILESYSFLGQRFKDNGRLAASYAQDGKVLADYESPAVYGASSGYFAVVAPMDEYEAYYRTKLASLYDPNKQAYRNTLSYYDDNWTWFGIALHENALVDLSR